MHLVENKKQYSLRKWYIPRETWGQFLAFLMSSRIRESLKHLIPSSSYYEGPYYLLLQLICWLEYQRKQEKQIRRGIGGGDEDQLQMTWHERGTLYERRPERQRPKSRKKRERIRTWTLILLSEPSSSSKMQSASFFVPVEPSFIFQFCFTRREQTGGHSSENTHVICFVVEDKDETERQVSPIREWNSLFSMSFEPSCCPASLALSWPSFYWVESTSWLTSWKRVTCVLSWTSVPDSPRIHISFRL